MDQVTSQLLACQSPPAQGGGGVGPADGIPILGWAGSYRHRRDRRRSKECTRGRGRLRDPLGSEATSVLQVLHRDGREPLRTGIQGRRARIRQARDTGASVLRGIESRLPADVNH